MSSDPVVSARDLSKRYAMYARPVDRLIQLASFGRLRRYVDFQALEAISFDLERGGTLGIVGRNGAGKSTLLQIVCGTLNPSGGSVAVRGRVAALLELGAGFNPEFTGRDNVRINAAVLGLTSAELDERMDDILAFADIGDFIDQPVKVFSSGMFVRLAFAVAIHVSPDLLVVDEALAVGDALYQARCMRRLKRMLDDGVALMFTSHDIAAIKAICRRTLWLEQGRPREYGPTDRVASLYIQDIVARSNASILGERAQREIGGDTVHPYDVSGEGGRDGWIDLSDTGRQRTGSGAVRIAGAAWHVGERPAQSTPVEWNDALTIETEVRVNTSVERLIISYHINDRHQQHVLGGHTRDDPRVYGTRWRPGDLLRVRFDVRLPLAAGDYTLTLLATSIQDVDRYADAVFLDYVDDVSVMKVMPRRPFPLSDIVEPPVEFDVTVRR